MINLYDIAYTLGLMLASPVWLARRKSREKVLLALGTRLGHVPVRESTGPAVLIHAVSLGEINATAEMVKQLLSARSDLSIIISTTTTAGYNRGRQLYAGKPRLMLVRFPLDLSPAVQRFLSAVNPSLVVLMEGEIWPNFLLRCRQRQIPVLLVNGRMTPSAFSRYRLAGAVVRRMLRRIDQVCAQDQVYADRFSQLGAPRVAVTGTMKFDTALLGDRVVGDEQLARELGIGNAPGPIWVCGSTGPGEETLLLAVYENLRRSHPQLLLVIVPRHPQRFDEVAALISRAGFTITRRSAGRPALDGSVILIDTLGELRKAYSLATVVFVGRSLVDLGSRQHGSDMIEPAALAKPVAVGPWTHNFAEAVRLFLSADAMREVATAEQLQAQIDRWLKNPEEAAAVGQRARETVKQHQGATGRHVAEIISRLPLP